MSSRRFWIIVTVSLALATLAVGWGVNTYLIDKQIERASEQLVLLGTLRRDALKRHLDTAGAELSFWSANDFLLSQQSWIVNAWRDAVAIGRDPAAGLRQKYMEGNPLPPGEVPTENANVYSELHSQLHPMAKLFVTKRGYHDFFLISPSGNIHYSVKKEDDFATNLLTGPYADTGLGEVFRQVIAAPDNGMVRVSDLQSYAPSAGMPVMFMARAMYNRDGEVTGVIALQTLTEQIHSIMQFDAGMGDTGETYLVGEDYLMRSDSRFSEESTVLRQLVKSDTVERALRGEHGVTFTNDYRGADVLSAYSSLPVGKTNWAVISEIDKAEILEGATSERPVIAGFMLFFYSIGVWSAWFVQRYNPAGEIGGELAREMDAATDFQGV